ncbi:glycosyltransferase family 2 protein [Candidatus Omnitrophota bacterium]
MPKISVIIPTYNRKKYLPDALDSVLKQTYQDFEIIIVDDGSLDNTKAVIEASINRYPKKIRYHYQQNRGAAAARNVGIQKAVGKYISFLDSDDLWIKDKLQKSIAFLENYKFDWVCTASFIVGEKETNGKYETRHIQSAYLDASGKRITLLKNGLFFFSSVPLYLPSVLAKNICFKKIGFFDEKFKIGEDFDMFFRMEEGKLIGGYLDEPLLVYRLNGHNITQSKDISGLRENIRLAKKHVNILGSDRRIIRNSYSEFLWRCADLFSSSGKYFDSAKCFVKSWYLHPEKDKFKKIFRFIKRRIKV